MNCNCNKNETVKHCWGGYHNFSWNQKKVVDRENMLIPRTNKETIHTLRSPNRIKKNQSFLHIS